MGIISIRAFLPQRPFTLLQNSWAEAKERMKGPFPQSVWKTTSKHWIELIAIPVIAAIGNAAVKAGYQAWHTMDMENSLSIKAGAALTMIAGTGVMFLALKAGKSGFSSYKEAYRNQQRIEAKKSEYRTKAETFRLSLERAPERYRSTATSLQKQMALLMDPFLDKIDREEVFPETWEEYKSLKGVFEEANRFLRTLAMIKRHGIAPKGFPQASGASHS